ncbi:MAG: magnesium chelatase family protein, partial [Saprospiraceae bacterium]
MLVKTYASAVQGVEAQVITVEVNAGGIVGPNSGFYHLVGLPDNAVKEGFQRIEAAIKNIGLQMKRLKLTINLAPADIRKEGSAYDLPIALGVLGATKQLESDKIGDYLFMGELALDGNLRPIKGALPIAIEARKRGFKGFILPKQN